MEIIGILALIAAVQVASLIVALTGGKRLKAELADTLNRFEEREKKRRQAFIGKVPGNANDQYQAWLEMIGEAGK